MKQLQPHPWEQVGEKYKTGERVRGTVTRVTDFGAFVELEPGVEGLIHLSEMSWSKKARKPSDVVKPGDAVEVVVLHVNPAERRISLGLKQALGDPWADAQQKYPVGGVVEGPVVSLTKFGAFVQIAEGVEGMIHVGDITAEKRINHPQEVLKPGQTVRAQILEVDAERRRIRLGMKQLQPTSIDEYIAEHKEGDVVTGRIADVSGGRAKVELGEGIQVPCKIAGAEPGQAEEQAGRIRRGRRFAVFDVVRQVEGRRVDRARVQANASRRGRGRSAASALSSWTPGRRRSRLNSPVSWSSVTKQIPPPLAATRPC